MVRLAGFMPLLEFALLFVPVYSAGDRYGSAAAIGGLCRKMFEVAPALRSSLASRDSGSSFKTKIFRARELLRVGYGVSVAVTTVSNFLQKSPPRGAVLEQTERNRPPPAPRGRGRGTRSLLLLILAVRCGAW